jgi:hypothetical protein
VLVVAASRSLFPSPRASKRTLTRDVRQGAGRRMRRSASAPKSARDARVAVADALACSPRARECEMLLGR